MAAHPIRRPPPPPPPPRPPHPPPAQIVGNSTPVVATAATAAAVSTGSSSGNRGGPGGGGETTSLTAAADLIRTLDSAFAEMSSLSACAAKDAEDARRNARAASEMARRYTARSFPSTPTGSNATAGGTPMMRSPQPPPTPTTTTTPVSSTETGLKTPITELRVDTGGAGMMMLDSISSSGGVGSISSPNRKRKNQRTPSSADRLAQSHVEDVLAVSLELERTKQELDQERREHDRTRMGFMEHRTKNIQLEAHIEKLLETMEKQREDHGRLIDSLRGELARTKSRVDAADEDAQAAIDLATEASASKQQVEAWLQKALEEIELLRNQLESVGVHAGSVMPTTPAPKKNSVRFADSPTVVVVSNQDTSLAVVPPPPTSPPRSMVAAGRNLLASARSPNPKMHVITVSPQRSAERRKILRERLKALDEEGAMPPTPSPIKSSLSPRISGAGGIADVSALAQTAMDACHSVAGLLKESAMTLKLAGRWSSASLPEDVENVENLARRYCNAVEVRSMSDILHRGVLSEF